MKIAYATTYDPNDRLQWSGLGHAIMQALHGADTTLMAAGPLDTPLPIVGRILSSIHRRAFNRVYEYQRTERVGRSYGRQIAAFLDRNNLDVVFSPGAIPVSQLNCKQPIVIYADATFRGYVEHYDLWKRYSRSTLRSAEATERSAFGRADLTIFASEWAAESARFDYDVPSEKIRVVPFGANLANPPNAARVAVAIADRPRNECNLISIGIDWDRKGMSRAVALAGALNQRGIETTLTIVGCKPPPGTIVPPYVHLAGFLDKRTSQGEKQLVEMLLSSHFHVLFSKAEAFGVVFSEANACGVPNIASDIGGIPTAVVNGAGGQRFGSDEPVERIADYLANALNTDSYPEIAHRARCEYEQRLNWSVSGAELRREIASLLQSQVG